MRLPFDGKIRITKLYGTPPPQGMHYATGKHSGIDMVAMDGKEVYAIERGTVIRSRYDGNGWGNYIVVQQSDGFYAIYCHLQKRNVTEGKFVKEGQALGIEGATGNVTGRHLHLELRKNYGDKYSTVNPADYLGIKNKLGVVEMAANKNEVSSWAKEARDWVMVNKISDGTSPKEYATREELWVMLQNLARYLEEEDKR